MPIEKVLTLSTSHIPEYVSALPDLGFDDDCPRVEVNVYGWMVFVGGCAVDWLTVVPEWLAPILQRAIDYGCTFINFDCDAEVEDFPTYEW